MDLLEKENKKTKSSKKNIVLMLLILSIVLLILALIMMSALKDSKPKAETLIINEQNVKISDNLIAPDANGNKYISLRGLAELIKYKYCNGSVFEVTEDKDKCYIQNQDSIVGFEADSNKIYKTIENSVIECQYYKLENPILLYNQNLYINLNDVQQACNLVVTNKDNNITINTPTYLIENLQKKFDEADTDIKLDVSDNSQKAISYNMLVGLINTKYGVLNLLNTNETIISAKYDSLEFDEYTKTFIASNNKKYGVISEKGKGIIDFKYDSIKIINYEPLLYEVTQNDNHGVINKDGEIIVEIKFENLGFENTTSDTTINSLLIIKEIRNSEDGIVIFSNGKYGVASLSNGKIILECELDKIYAKLSTQDELINYVEFNGKEYTLEEYIKYVNTITVVNDVETNNEQNDNTEINNEQNNNTETQE